MTTKKQKALEAFDRLISDIIPMDRHPGSVEHDVDTVRNVLTEQDAHDINTCPSCGGEADNGHDRCHPPNPYNCTKCEAQLVMDDEVREAFLIADARDAAVMALDFGNVFWACGILAKALRAATRAPDAELVNKLVAWKDHLRKHEDGSDTDVRIAIDVVSTSIEEAIATYKEAAHGGKEG